MYSNCITNVSEAYKLHGVEATYVATNTENMVVMIAKSSRSRIVICAAGEVFLPIIARIREDKDGDF